VDFLYQLKEREKFIAHQPIPILSFFTGAGFLDIGFKRAGFNIIWKNEIDPVFIKSFEYGMSAHLGLDTRIDAPLSIDDLSSKEILSTAFHNTPRPELFGIIGGPPCPDFSVGGKNRGREGDHGRLLKSFADRISEIQPTFFVIENVPGLVKTSKHRDFLKDTLELLSTKYAISIGMLNSLEFGVAQDRYRVFIIGFLRNWLKTNAKSDVSKNGIEWRYIIEQINSKKLRDEGMYHQYQLFPEGHWYPWPIDNRYLFAKTKFNWPNISPFMDNPEKIDGIPDELMVGPLICNQNEISELVNGKEGFLPHCDRFFTVEEGDVSRKSFKRLHRWRFSPTAAYGNNEVHLHPMEPRRLTVREACRIQSVPDSYIFPRDVSLSSKFKMIGNGVPVRLAEVVGLSVACALKGNFYNPLVLSQNPDDK
jgi:DNA (cytosine-5)-methyltransferase 1